MAKEICPVCQNEEISPQANFCKICGTRLVRDERSGEETTGNAS